MLHRRYCAVGGSFWVADNNEEALTIGNRPKEPTPIGQAGITAAGLAHGGAVRIFISFPLTVGLQLRIDKRKSAVAIVMVGAGVWM